MLLLLRPSYNNPSAGARRPAAARPVPAAVTKKAEPILLSLEPLSLDLFYRKLYLEWETLRLLSIQTQVTRNHKLQLIGHKLSRELRPIAYSHTQNAWSNLLPLTRALERGVTDFAISYNKRFDEDMAIALLVALRKRKNGKNN